MPKKSASGSGSIRQRKDGTWEGRYSAGYDPGTGNRIRKSVYAPTQKEVRQKLAQITAALDNGTYSEPSKLDVEQWLDIWLNEYAAPAVKPLTLSTYRTRIKVHVLPAMGKLKLSKLNTTIIQKFVNDLTREKGLAPKTVRNTYAILREALDKAYELDYIPKNYADPVTLPRMTQREIKPFDEKQIAAFLRELEESGEVYARLYAVTLFTGMREGEVCGLSWDAVNFEEGTITIKQQLQKGKEAGTGYFISTTKSDKARTITPAPYVMKLLREQMQEQNVNRIYFGKLWKDEWNLVFTQYDGRHIPPQTVLKHFKKHAAAIGCPDARFHDLRHSYAVASLSEGDDVKTVQTNLGHATAAFTLDVYGHVTEKMKQESAKRMESFIEKVSG
jgi:integrase